MSSIFFNDCKIFFVLQLLNSRWYWLSLVSCHKFKRLALIARPEYHAEEDEQYEKNAREKLAWNFKLPEAKANVENVETGWFDSLANENIANALRHKIHHKSDVKGDGYCDDQHHPSGMIVWP